MEILKSLEEFGIDWEQGSCKRPWDYSHHMLSLVSRTFALNIQVLPMSLKRPILLAYLFCRMADTLEDDKNLSKDKKVELLESFRLVFVDRENWRVRLQEFVNLLPQEWFQSEDCDQLLTAWPLWPMDLFFDLADKYINAVSPWIIEMCDGMIDYSNKRDGQKGWMGLESVDELDDYCYYVAGTVGYMLCDLFFVYSPLINVPTYRKMKELAVSFGLGLQVTNIIKDMKEDATRNTCFVPQALFEKYGTTPDALIEGRDQEEMRKVVDFLVLKAFGHLEDAKNYSLLIPRLEPKIRLFCLWPLFMATATLAEVNSNDKVLTDDKVKITRDEVKGIIKGTTLKVLFNSSIEKMFLKDKTRIFN